MDRVPYYAATLYHTECVRWFVDGRIQVRTGSYNTMSTAKFMHAVSPFTTQLFDNRVWVRGIPMANDDVGLTFTKREGEWVCLNLPKPYTKHRIRAEAKRLRDLPTVKAIQEYLKNMKALGAWDNRPYRNSYSAKHKLRDILTAHLGLPQVEPALEVLAELGEHSHGPVEVELLYTVCMEVGLTDDGMMYERRDVPIGTMQKGVYCE